MHSDYIGCLWHHRRILYRKEIQKALRVENGLYVFWRICHFPSCLWTDSLQQGKEKNQTYVKSH